MKVWKIFMAGVAMGMMLFASAAFAQPESPCNPCVTFCTYTQGGWGAPCNGGNAGCLRDQYFDSIYPGGVTIGGIYTILFTSAQAVEDFLPQGQTPDYLHQNYVDPGVGNITEFAGQVLALELSVDFGIYGANGMPDISGLVINGGPFDGYTVAQLLALANQVLGSDVGALPEGTTIGDLNGACTAINQNFDNCTENDHYLIIPPQGETVIARDYGEELPLSFCLNFTAQCSDLCIIWWCPFCQPGDFAHFTTCVEGDPACDPDCPTVPNVVWGDQMVIEDDPNGGCWWYTTAHSDDPGCLCITFDYQLPVDVASFTAVPGNNLMTLNWTTANEYHNDHFVITRDGLTVAQVNGTNSPTGSSYSWADHDVTNGQSYTYTLSAVDVAGNVSEVGTVENATPGSVVTPTEFALYQNYPNPFNPTTSIGFDIAKNGPVTLRVYNMIGEEVATLVNGNLNTGHHDVTFDASKLPSALYIYRLEAPGFSASNKMLLLK